MRVLTKLLMFVCCLMVAACSRHELPPIKDTATLRKDCAVLYEQFPVSELSTNAPDYQYLLGLGIRKISNDKWSPSILALHPYLVCSYQGGIQMWISGHEYKDQGKWWDGYYVVVKSGLPPPPQAASNHFVFHRTDQDGVFLLKQAK